MAKLVCAICETDTGSTNPCPVCGYTSLDRTYPDGRKVRFVTKRMGLDTPGEGISDVLKQALGENDTPDSP